MDGTVASCTSTATAQESSDILLLRHLKPLFPQGKRNTLQGKKKFDVSMNNVRERENDGVRAAILTCSRTSGHTTDDAFTLVGNDIVLCSAKCANGQTVGNRR